MVLLTILSVSDCVRLLAITKYDCPLTIKSSVKSFLNLFTDAE
jgi:hypothetical protein